MQRSAGPTRLDERRAVAEVALDALLPVHDPRRHGGHAAAHREHVVLARHPPALQALGRPAPCRALARRREGLPRVHVGQPDGRRARRRAREQQVAELHAAVGQPELVVEELQAAQRLDRVRVYQLYGQAHVPRRRRVGRRCGSGVAGGGGGLDLFARTLVGTARSEGRRWRCSCAAQA